MNNEFKIEPIIEFKYAVPAEFRKMDPEKLLKKAIELYVKGLCKSFAKQAMDK